MRWCRVATRVEHLHRLAWQGYVTNCVTNFFSARIRPSFGHPVLPDALLTALPFTCHAASYQCAGKCASKSECACPPQPIRSLRPFRSLKLVPVARGRSDTTGAVVVGETQGRGLR